MGISATPAGRRSIVAVLLLLAVAGAVIRALAPDPSTLRDVGTLLLVLWLPALGSLIAYLLRKIPRRAPAAPGFPVGSPFVPHLHARLEPTGLVRDLQAALAAADHRCMLVVGQAGFTVRLGGPLPADGEQPVALELLRPAVSLPMLAAGTEFHLMVGPTAAAKGRVVATGRGD